MNNPFEKYAHVHSFRMDLSQSQAALLLVVKNCDNEAAQKLRRYVPTIKALLKKGLVEHTAFWAERRPFKEMPLGTKKRPSFNLTEEGKFVMKLLNKTTILEIAP